MSVLDAFGDKFHKCVKKNLIDSQTVLVAFWNKKMFSRAFISGFGEFVGLFNCFFYHMRPWSDSNITSHVFHLFKQTLWSFKL